MASSVTRLTGFGGVNPVLRVNDVAVRRGPMEAHRACLSSSDIKPMSQRCSHPQFWLRADKLIAFSYELAARS